MSDSRASASRSSRRRRSKGEPRSRHRGPMRRDGLAGVWRGAWGQLSSVFIARGRGQGVAHVFDHRSPIAARLLPKQARGGIPRAVGAIEEPPPIGNELQHDPNGFAHGTSQMSYGGVDGYDEVEASDGSSGLSKVGEHGCQINKIGMGLRCRADLEAKEPGASYLKDRRQRRKAY